MRFFRKSKKSKAKAKDKGTKHSRRASAQLVYAGLDGASSSPPIENVPAQQGDSNAESLITQIHGSPPPYESTRNLFTCQFADEEQTDEAAAKERADEDEAAALWDWLFVAQQMLAGGRAAEGAGKPFDACDLYKEAAALLIQLRKDTAAFAQRGGGCWSEDTGRLSNDVSELLQQRQQQLSQNIKSTLTDCIERAEVLQRLLQLQGATRADQHPRHQTARDHPRNQAARHHSRDQTASAFASAGMQVHKLRAEDVKRIEALPSLQNGKPEDVQRVCALSSLPVASASANALSPASPLYSSAHTRAATTNGPSFASHLQYSRAPANTYVPVPSHTRSLTQPTPQVAFEDLKNNTDTPKPSSEGKPVKNFATELAEAEKLFRRATMLDRIQFGNADRRKNIENATKAVEAYEKAAPLFMNILKTYRLHAMKRSEIKGKLKRSMDRIEWLRKPILKYNALSELPVPKADFQRSPSPRRSCSQRRSLSLSPQVRARASKPKPGPSLEKLQDDLARLRESEDAMEVPNLEDDVDIFGNSRGLPSFLKVTDADRGDDEFPEVGGVPSAFPSSRSAVRGHPNVDQGDNGNRGSSCRAGSCVGADSSGGAGSSGEAGFSHQHDSSRAQGYGNQNPNTNMNIRVRNTVDDYMAERAARVALREAQIAYDLRKLREQHEEDATLDALSKAPVPKSKSDKDDKKKNNRRGGGSSRGGGGGGGAHAGLVLA